MKSFWHFLKVTAVTGLFILLPVALIIKVLAEVAHFAQKAAGPVLKLLPKGVLEDPTFPVLFDVFVLLLTCFVTGLLARMGPARALGKWVEHHLLQPIPGYMAIKNLARGLSGSLEASSFKAAVLTSPESGSVLVYLIEDQGDGLVTVMIPSAPNPMGGTIKIVPRERVRILNVKIATVARVVTQWGVGAQDLLHDGKSR